VTVRILADREPYASFADETLPDGDVLVNGPPALDTAPPDIVVMPASDFLVLARGSASLPGFIVYGPVALMDRAFERGCIDYLREPWSLPELRARLRRLRNRDFRAFGTLFRLRGSVLAGDGAFLELREEELALFRILLRNAPLLVTREAASTRLFNTSQDKYHALGRCAVSLRHKLELFAPGLGTKLHVVRGLGYRLDVELCG
jgi:hypothetical protein